MAFSWHHRMENTTMFEINQARFLRTLEEMGQIGLLPDAAGGGRNRYPFSAADRAARDYFRYEAQDSGLTVTLDAAANLSARLDCGDPSAQTVLIGSHLDTVPHGGAYDGAFGVLAGLEVLRTLKEQNIPLVCNVEVIDFTDEEGRFGHFFGSGALTGQLSDAHIETFLRNAAAHSADLALMREIVPGGLTLDAIRSLRRAPSSLAGYVELHIEQGPRLEEAHVPIGVVSAIFGRRSWEVTFHGRPDHAGTTPLPMRSDALVSAARFIVRAQEIVAGDFPDAVVTCGNVIVSPGVSNVVPNKTMVEIEFRAATAKELDQIEARLEHLRNEVTLHTRTTSTRRVGSETVPTPMDGDIQGAIRAAAERCGYPTLDLPSGAGHDAMLLANVTPAAMLFVPSHNGRSHCPDEHTDPDDLVAGANVLLHTILTLAG
ncbi:hydantoinase/carbamoylase family amidase [bacterium]|nr:hydantoinase/carbamoylase family amidase [bacterium]